MDPAHIRTFKVTQSDHAANIISLCRRCHQEQHASWRDFLEKNPHVLELLLEKGWDISQDPFNARRLIFTHPEIK